MYEVRQVMTDSPTYDPPKFEVVDIHPRGDIVEGRYATEDEAIDKAKELNILEGITERYEDEVQLLQQSLRAWVNRVALDAGIDVTVLEEHVGYGENTL
jgi:hypothetical protein